MGPNREFPPLVRVRINSFEVANKRTILLFYLRILFVFLIEKCLETVFKSRIFEQYQELNNSYNHIHGLTGLGS
jgi:hypothetical protein